MGARLLFLWAQQSQPNKCFSRLNTHDLSLEAIFTLVPLTLRLVASVYFQNLQISTFQDT